MESTNPSIVNPLNPPVKKSTLPMWLIGIFIVIAGAVSGYFLAAPKSTASRSVADSQTGAKVDGKEIGSSAAVFKDNATGTIEKGGFNGEGTHKLIRPGGESQTVYLVSSVIDLDEVAGKKVEVFGQTLRAQKVGWLMDVGRIKILD